MRFILVHHVIADRGSAQDMYNYARVAKTLGHEVVLYGQPLSDSPFDYTLDIDSADAVIFILEWTTDLQYGDNLDLVRLAAKVPRERRIVIDCDGKYNDAIGVIGDYNHPDEATSRWWVEICDSLSDRIFQPTFHPKRANVRPFFFHAYDAAWEVPLDFSAKEFGMVYVGNNWFRWRSVHAVLQALEPIRDRVGRLAIVGNGWDAPAPWANSSLIEDAYCNDPDYLQQQMVEVMPPIQFDQVVATMGKGVFSPVIYRPLFDDLRLVTCRTFETLAANTIPLFAQEPDYVEEIYGECALELVLAGHATEKMLDVLDRPEHYAKIVMQIRQHLRETFSYEARVEDFVNIIEKGE